MGRRHIVKKPKLLGLIVTMVCIWVAYSLSQSALLATTGATTTDDTS